MNNERANNMKLNNEGMTLPELVLAILMLTAFTAITVMVTEFTSRFFQPLNEEAKEEYILSGKEFSDVLNHHLKINNAFDRIIEIFSEPGIDKNFILNLKCTSLPSLEWSIPSIDNDAIPTSYKICINLLLLLRVIIQNWRTTMANQEFTFFIQSQKMASPLMQLQ